MEILATVDAEAATASYRLSRAGIEFLLLLKRRGRIFRRRTPASLFERSLTPVRAWYRPRRITTKESPNIF
jgi:hypothetical protein